MRKTNRGITLIALVITIIILLILATVAINMAINSDGLFQKANEAREKDEIKKKEEEVFFAISSLRLDRVGTDQGPILPQDIADELNKNKPRNITANPTDTYPTQIIFPAESNACKKEIRVGVNKQLSIIAETGDAGDGNYSVSGVEPSPIELFLYEVIDDTTARITGLNPVYCSGGEDEPNTNYTIDYNGTKLVSLVIPYEAQIGGKTYQIMEVCLDIQGAYGTMETRLPADVETIIYPNQVKRIYTTGDHDRNIFTQSAKTIILPKQLEEIGDYVFKECQQLTSIVIPDSVTKIGVHSFNGCSSLTTVKLSENLKSIGRWAFMNCSNLTEIVIPSSVTQIDVQAFNSVTNIKVRKAEGSIPNAPWGGKSVEWNYTK